MCKSVKLQECSFRHVKETLKVFFLYPVSFKVCMHLNCDSIEVTLPLITECFLRRRGFTIRFPEHHLNPCNCVSTIHCARTERARESSIDWMPFSEQLLTGLCDLSIFTAFGTWAHPCELSINTTFGVYLPCDGNCTLLV